MKKKVLKMILISAIGVMFSSCSDTDDKSYDTPKNKVKLNISFLDKKWDGKVVPKDEVCSEHNRNGVAGSSPALVISNLPNGTDYIVLSFSDETFKGMNNGGHGILGYSIEDVNTSPLTIPSVKGESFNLPKGFSIEKKHRGVKFGKKAGAYLAPCSGGGGNLYTVNVKAVDISKSSKDSYYVVGEKSLSLGRY